MLNQMVSGQENHATAPNHNVLNCKWYNSSNNKSKSENLFY